MKQITLVVLAVTLLVLPGSLFGENRAKAGSLPPSTHPCGPGKFVATDSMVAQYTPRHTGECICPPMPGAVQSGCGGHDEVGCGLQLCHYKTFDVTGGVADEGDISCIWQPAGFPK